MLHVLNKVPRLSCVAALIPLLGNGQASVAVWQSTCCAYRRSRVQSVVVSRPLPVSCQGKWLPPMRSDPQSCQKFRANMRVISPANPSRVEGGCLTHRPSVICHPQQDGAEDTGCRAWHGRLGTLQSQSLEQGHLFSKNKQDLD